MCFDGMPGMGWMTVAMGGAGLLVVLVLLLTAAALVKYLWKS